jgi:hypothetical protein
MNKTRWQKWWGFVTVLVAVLGTTSMAAAQRVVVVGEGGYYDGPRLRAGISVGAGGLFAGGGYGVGLAGVDGRIGVQINNLVGVYAQPYFVGGDGSYAAGSGSVVSFGADAVIDFTLASRFFIGVGGGGGGTLFKQGNGDSGQLIFRAGFYPIVVRRFRRPGRGGLMVGLDVRPIFLTGFGNGEVSLVQATANIGWELF